METSRPGNLNRGQRGELSSPGKIGPESKLLFGSQFGHNLNMKTVKLKKIDPNETGAFREKDDAKAETEKYLKKMYDLLYLMFAHDRYSLLIILHGIDASGKDGTVRLIFSGANPQGVRVYSFKQPSQEELRHDFLWRCHRCLPESGFAAIFNRSYYEEVTTVQVHPEYLKAQRLPDEIVKDPKFFEKRYACINDFERMLTEKGTIVLKLFLHISKDEQKERLQERLQDRRKNWKFSEADITERKHWNRYQDVFEEMLNRTSTSHAPWNVIPANHKWYRDYLTAKTIVEALEQLKMKYPKSQKQIRIR
jgi:PPK2 family polyphosphate:nucleotide phosphotransferase